MPPFRGGIFPIDGFENLLKKLRAEYPFLEKDQSERLVRSYGTCAYEILGDAKTETDLGQVFCNSLSEREVIYLMEKEWAKSAEDILWRRSKLGIGVSPKQISELEDWMKDRLPETRVAFLLVLLGLGQLRRKLQMLQRSAPSSCFHRKTERL